MKNVNTKLTLAMTMVLILGIAFKNKQEAKACNYFKRTSVKKCAVTPNPETYEYTGAECRPEVTVNYMGTNLEKGVDYVVEYILYLVKVHLKELLLRILNL